MCDIIKIEAKKVLGVLDNSIQIFLKKDNDSTSEKGYIFMSFSNRDTAYKRIISIYRVFKKANNCN